MNTQRRQCPSRRLDVLFVTVIGVLNASCGRSATAPSTPPLSIGCPAPISAQTLGDSTSVSFADPQTSGGRTPTQATCSKPSGSIFPIGSTLITCNAIDAAKQTATCSFSVTVSRAPQVRFTRFTAFGDSITEGIASSCSGLLPSLSFEQSKGLFRRLVSDTWTYPNVLQSLLRGRYTLQSPTVNNRGLGGEEVTSGLARLPTVLGADNPEVLLLMEGTNDVVQGRTSTAIADTLRSMIRTAKRANASVFLGTLAPQTASPCRPYLNPAAVPPVNDAIRALATSEGVPLVDTYQRLGGRSDVIGPDGLHPTVIGYAEIAQAFFLKIQSELEVVTTPRSSTSSGASASIGGTEPPHTIR